MALVALLVLGCAGDPDATPPPPPPPPHETGHTGLEALAFVEPPALRENPGAGLTAWLDARASAPTRLELTVTVGDRSWTLEAPLASRHEVLILGLRADTDVAVDVVAVDELGRSVAGRATGRAPPLPAGLVAPTVLAASPERMEPGVTVLADSGFVYLVDADGEPVWFVPVDGAVREVGLWPGPHVAIVVAREQIDEIDLSGALVRRFGGIRSDEPYTPVDAFATHHDVRLLPDGNVLTFDVERRWMSHPTSETDPAAPWAETWVAGDVVLELAPDGSTVRRWPLLDLLDPERIGYNSVTGDFWETFGPWAGDDVHDWAHANALSYDPATDTILASLRHQDAVVGFARSTGELRWILGNPAWWVAPWDAALLRPEPEPEGFRWHWHQHGAQFTPSGTVVMFDNGNFGVPAYVPQRPDRVSRALEVRLEPEAGTFEVVWAWGDELGLFSGSLGEADVLPLTDHVLVTYGGGEEMGAARVIEVARDGTIVWDVASRPGAQWFRSGRWTGVIPGPGR